MTNPALTAARDEPGRRFGSDISLALASELDDLPWTEKVRVPMYGQLLSLVENDLVDCMIALPGQLFFTTGIPVCLWFLAKSKAADAKRAFRDRRRQTRRDCKQGVDRHAWHIARAGRGNGRRRALL